MPSNLQYRIEDFVEEDVEVWDENWDVLHLYQEYSTQWRSGGFGPTGLDFNVFHHALDRKGVSEKDYDNMIAQLRVIEAQALIEMHKQ